jgi:hypothetical protein
MCISFFFQISKEFFDSIHSPYIDEHEFIDNSLALDEENNYITYRELLEFNNEDLCYCYLCKSIRQLLLFINPKIYKQKHI